MIVLELIAKFTTWLEEVRQPPEVKAAKRRKEEERQKRQWEVKQRQAQYNREQGWEWICKGMGYVIYSG